MADATNGVPAGEQLSPRESELLKKAGERIFALSRRVSAAERETERLTAENTALRELVAEVRNMRDVLSSQVSSLLREKDREYEERSELRRLLASLHMQMQEVLPLVTTLVAAQQPPSPVRAEPAADSLPHHESARMDTNGRSSIFGPWSYRILEVANRELRLLPQRGAKAMARQTSSRAR